ncbi:MAG: acyl-CoA thioesterase [Anaerolineae bacterium]
MTLEPKHISDSRVTLSVMMGPQDTNGLGNVHGGVIMRLVDEAGGLAAMRHARRPAVTVAMDSMTFMQPIRVGMLVMFQAELTYVGRTSMEVRVQVVAENPLEGSVAVTNTAYLVFVALDEQGRPTPVPPLAYETEDEKHRAQLAQERQAYRKQQQHKEAETWR